MKRILITIFILAVLVGAVLSPVFGAVTNTLTGKRPTAYWWTGEPLKDIALLQARELEVLLGATAGTSTASKALILSASRGVDSLLFTPTDTPPTATEGRLYYSDADEALKLYTTSSGWVDIDVSGASSLATAYTAGSKILAATLAVEIEVANSSNNSALILDFDDTATNGLDCFQIDTEADDAGAIAIQIDGVAGIDIRGSGDVWYVTYDGLATVVGLVVGAEDIELENGAEIQNVVDTEIRFLEDNGSADEDLIFDFGTNKITLKSGTSVAELAMGDVDDLTGVGTIVFDDAASTITETGTTNGFDLTIAQAGTIDVSLILSSAGSITDALSLITTDSVGVIKISSSDVLDIDTVDDIDIDISDGTYTLTIGGSADGDYVMTAADNYSAIVVGSLLLQNTEAASDITINSVLGTVIIEGEEDCADAVLITADGSTASTLRLFNDTGTSVTEGAASIELLSDVGGIELRSTANLANAIALTVENSTTSSILVYNDSGTSVTEDGYSIEILSDDGGVEIKSGANLAKAINIMVDNNTTSSIMIFNDTGTSVGENTASIDIWSDAGGIEIQSDANLDDAIIIRVDGGTTSEMTIHNDRGTAADSIEIVSDDGGITITAGDATTADILIDANDILTLLSASIAADGIYLHTNGGAAEGIKIHSDQGTSADSVELLSDVGGITIETAGTTAGDILIDANDIITIVSASLAADGIYLHTDGGVTEGILLRSDQGTSADSIELLSDVGGITITTAATTAGDILIDANDQLDFASASVAAGGITATATTDFKIEAALVLNDIATFSSSDTTPDVTGASYFLTHASTQTLTDFDGTIDTGHIIWIESTAAVTFDVTGQGLAGGTTDLVTADGDLTSWIYNGTDWLLIQFMDIGTDYSTGM